MTVPCPLTTLDGTADGMRKPPYLADCGIEPFSLVPRASLMSRLPAQPHPASLLPRPTPGPWLRKLRLQVKIEGLCSAPAFHLGLVVGQGGPQKGQLRGQGGRQSQVLEGGVAVVGGEASRRPMEAVTCSGFLSF